MIDCLNSLISKNNASFVRSAVLEFLIRPTRPETTVVWKARSKVEFIIISQIIRTFLFTLRVMKNLLGIGLLTTV